MNSTTRWITALLIALSVLVLGYRTRTIIANRYAIITIATAANTTSWQHLQFEHYFPGIAQKTLEATTLQNILKADSLYKIITPSAFDQSKPNHCIQLSQQDKESKFIHATRGSQVISILDKFFKDTPTVLIVELDQQQLQKNRLSLKLEHNKPDSELFPHIYGAMQIPVSALKSIIEAQKQPDGTWHVQSISIVVSNNQLR